MTIRVTPEEYRQLQAKMTAAKPRKYRNVRAAATTLDPGSEYTSPVAGRRVYDSKAEAKHAAELDRMVKAGLIRSWVPQVSLPLPNSAARLMVDFMVIQLNGKADFQDIKGAPPTRLWLHKADQLKRSTGIEIQIVRRK